jgi:hypothetical protein
MQFQVSSKIDAKIFNNLARYREMLFTSITIWCKSLVVITMIK